MALLVCAAGACGGGGDRKLDEVALDGPSMEPTVQAGGLVRYEPVDGDLQRGDIVLFGRAGDAPHDDLVKRVIGLPGETVRIRSCTVFVDDAALDEPYIANDVADPTARCRIPLLAPVPVGVDEVFVMGDNRPLSFDSREFGPIAVDDVVGVVREIDATGNGDWVDAATEVSVAENGDLLTGDPVVDPLIGRLEASPAPPFTATYKVTAKYGPAEFPAVVAVDGTRSSVTVGDVRFLESDAGVQTCAVSTGSCTPGFDEARISDTGVVHDFSTAGAASRIRREVRSASGPATAEIATVAGIAADCAAMTGTGGPVTMCVTPDGHLAVLDVAEVNITLDALDPTVAEAVFTPTG